MRKQYANIESSEKTAGFTLIELSIVLVIIGLVIGGIMVGKDMISAAQSRSVIAQIEQYQTAVHTFRTKYNCLPGDCAKGAEFGFPARGSLAGEGNGDGILMGYSDAPAPGVEVPTGEIAGESAVFWVDLSMANLIDGSFTTASESSMTCSTLNIGKCWPKAKIGNGNFIYSLSWNNINYFAISSITSVGASFFYTDNRLTVQQAYVIDQKMDDALPDKGGVIAARTGTDTGGNLLYLYPGWPGSNVGWDDSGWPRPPSATSCMDDGGNTGSQKHYSLAQNSGDGLNCALIFRFR